MLSAEAQLTYHRAYVLAGVCDAGGLLIKDDQPYGIEALYNPQVKRLDRAVEELQFKKDMDGLPWFRSSLYGAIEVVGWYADQVSQESIRKTRQRGRDSHGVDDGKGRDIPRDSHGVDDGKGRDIPRDSHGVESKKPRDIRSTEIYIEPPPVVDKSTPSGGTAIAKNGSAPWVLALKDQVRPLLDASLPDLTLETRLLVGRYLAFRVANCAVKEPANVKMGRKFAGQIAEISSKKRSATVSVSEFLGAANRLWEASQQYPLYSLWPVFAAFEDEAK